MIVLDRFFYPVKNWKKKCLQKALVFADIVQIFLASEKFPQKKVFKCLKKNLQEAFMFASIGEIFLSSANFPQKNVLKKCSQKIIFKWCLRVLGRYWANPNHNVPPADAVDAIEWILLKM